MKEFFVKFQMMNLYISQKTCSKYLYLIRLFTDESESFLCANVESQYDAIFKI